MLSGHHTEVSLSHAFIKTIDSKGQVEREQGSKY